MLIVSKFKDYYDSVAFTKGVDKSIIYKRENNSILDKRFVRTRDTKDYYFPSFSIAHSSVVKYSRYGLTNFSTYIIGFCGKLYPLMITETCIKNNNHYMSDIKQIDYIYDLETIKEYHKKYCSSWEGNISNFEEMLNSKMILELFYEYKSPIFILSGESYNWLGNLNNDSKNIQLNPNLKEIQFYKVFETAATFQELEMYISGVLGIDTQKIIEVSDKSKIEGHGFDFKTSFRKEKKQ